MEGLKATSADVMNCFRLLLGREPHPVEVAGHLSRVGEDLTSVVAAFVNSAEFESRALANRNYLARIETADLGTFKLCASPDDAAVGRHALGGVYEPHVQAAFRTYVKPGMTVLDVGANIGFFTMLAASLTGPGGFVLAVEPNPANAKLIEANKRLNGFEHVRIAQVGAWRNLDLFVLNTDFTNGSVAPARDNLESLFAATTVPVIPLDQLLEPTRRVGLIKIDVEGAEHAALEGAASLIGRDHPVIISEFSPHNLAGKSGTGGTEYLTWLVERGYSLSVLEKDGRAVEFGRRIAAVIKAFDRSGIDHIDIVAIPD